MVTWDKPTQSFFKSDNLHIGCDNPFLPSSIAQACLANNGQTAAYNSQFTSIPQPAGGIAGTGGSTYAPAANIDVTSANPTTLGAFGPAGSPVNNGFVNGFTAGSMAYGAQNSVLQNVENYNNRTTRRYVIGAEGVFNLFDTDWTVQGLWRAWRSGFHNILENILVTPYYDAAIDAVQVTANNAAAFPGVPVGSVICRSVAARSVGCVPLNIIGTTGASPAARSFVQGLNAGWQFHRAPMAATPGRSPTPARKCSITACPATPFEDWAGKISVATGFQYREEALTTQTDCASRGNCANESFGGVAYGPAGNPLLNAAAPAPVGSAAGCAQLVCRQLPARPRYFHEWEVFLETNVPLLNDPAWGKLDADLAGRYTHYTTSGDVETWKVGMVWDTPLDGVRLRALQSRDVRAPNLAELFAGARVNNGSVTDHFAC